MASVKVGPELVRAIKLAYAADQPVLLVGMTGVGKSEILAQAAQEMKIGFLARDLSLMEPVDLAGIPIIQDRRTEYAPPSYLPSKGKGIIAFEELNRSPRHVRAPCLQLLTARCLNDYRLPPKWLPCAAINPAGDEYDVDELDPALLARFMTLNVVPDKTSWLRWATENNVHPSVRTFVEATPKAFNGGEGNPRAWASVGRLLRAAEETTAHRGMLLAGIAGLVGDRLALAFMATYGARKAGSIPSVAGVLKSYGKVRTMVQEWAERGDTARLASLIHQLMLHLQDPENETAVRDNGRWSANLKRLCSDMPAEFRRRLREAHPWLGKTRRRKRA